jgi:folate-binding protein YgfZ
MTNPFLENFFREHGATFTDGQICFGETPADFDQLAQQTTVSVMMAHGLLQVQSTDNLKFLQGQFTCDVKEVTPQQWRYGALCTHQGRVIANFLLLQAADNQHILRVSTDTLGALQETLNKFAPFYRATLSNRVNDFVLLGLQGPQAAALTRQVFQQVPDVGNVVQTVTISATIVCLAEQRFECWIKNEALVGLWPQLVAQAKPTGCAYWQLLNIRAGLGEVRQSTIEAWTPHMLNLQSIGAISFKKGCYTGQEIVARTEYRGHQKRAMYRISGTGHAPDPAAPVMAGEHSAGEIVLASPSGEQQWEGLAVLAETHLDRPLSCNHQPIQQLNLPYAVKTAHRV